MAVLAALIFTSIVLVLRVESSWCVARSDASDQALQAALDYACGFGADCAPILSDGLCYLPNTLLAHASYAYNSYYQRKGRAPGSCDFAGTANIARTDPSYGSCIYPSKPRYDYHFVSPGRPITPLATQPTLYRPATRGYTPALWRTIHRASELDRWFRNKATNNSRPPPQVFKTIVTTLILVLLLCFSFYMCFHDISSPGRLEAVGVSQNL
nr:PLASMODESMATA CALLOSE-BINDING PROTEIN 3-like [Ipomoea batatas]